jgi:tetratricopeptide (TPR) repeat protein
VLRKHGSDAQTQEYAKVLGAGGLLAFCQADYPAAQAHLEGCLAIRRKFGDLKGMVVPLNNLGNVFIAQGDYPSALRFFDESLQIYKELGD